VSLAQLKHINAYLQTSLLAYIIILFIAIINLIIRLCRLYSVEYGRPFFS